LFNEYQLFQVKGQTKTSGKAGNNRH